ncbi:MAG: DUF4019 domain-containing protein [Gemmatimonadota bacterium]
MHRRSTLAATILLLLAGGPLVAQEVATEVADTTEEVDAGEEVDRSEAAGSEAADGDDGAPHPHAAFDFPSSELESAADAGLAWLELVDAGEYEESWAIASATLQSSATPQQLKSMINGGRKPFRPLGARTLVGFSQLDNPPNAAPGDYVMLQYRTAASGDRTIIETVVPRQDGDAWRVAAYFIQRE